MLVSEGLQRLITQKLGCAVLQPAASRQRFVRPAHRCFVAEKDSVEGVKVRCFIAEQAHDTLQQLRRPKGRQGVSQQTLRIGRLRDPQQLTAYIKHRKEAALSPARGVSLEAGLTAFCDSMDALICTAGSHINHIHFAAVITASAHVWEAAQTDSTHAICGDLHHKVERVYWQCVQGLQPLLSDTAPQQISTVLWASATLGFNPDKCVPGMVHALMHRFLQLIHTTDARQRPNAQSCANLIWAVATMRHPAASATEALNSACSHFAHLLRSSNVKQRPKAKEVASLVWSLSTLKHTPRDDALLNDLCVHMLTLLQSQECRTWPNAHATSSMLWGLAELKHAPPHPVGSALLDHLRGLCQTPGRQPTPQAISNSLHACAVLTLNVTSACVEALVNHLLGMPVAQVSYQHYSNVAWSLAVMKRLNLDTFDALFSRLSVKHSLHVEHSGFTTRHAQPRLEEACQLQQALEALKPKQGSNQMDIWLTLRLRLQQLAPEPIPPVMSLPGQTDLWAALALLNVPFTACGLCGMYWADAVVSLHNSSAAQIILMVDRAEECFSNVPGRHLGHVDFRLRLLRRHGTVVSVPYRQDKSSPSSMACDIQAALAAQTRSPVESCCR